MRAVVFNNFGKPSDVLQVREVAVPQPGAGEVRVRMLASPVNPSDLMMVRGQYDKLPQLPATPGFEGVGIVETAGAGLFGKLLVGKRVAVLNGTTGNWQEQTVIPAKQAIPVGNGISVDQAAMFFVNPATALIMTREVLKVPPGAWLLQTAAGSALGKMVIRLGRRFGFRTLNIVRRAAQVAELQALGADAVVADGPETVRKTVLEITHGKGVPYAIDPVGGAIGSAVVGCLAHGGRMLVFGTLSGEPLSLGPRDLMTAGTSITGFWLANWMTSQGMVGKLRLVRAISKLVRDEVLISEVGETFLLDQVTAAVERAEQPERRGKVLLRIAEA